MKAIVFLLVTLLCAVDDESTFLALEKKWNEAHLKGDVVVLDELWANELVVTVQEMPVMNKAQSLSITKSKVVKFSKYESADVKVNVYGDSAVVTGKLLRTRFKNGKDIEDNWRFTKVYVKRDGKWKVVAWHGSQAMK